MQLTYSDRQKYARYRNLILALTFFLLTKHKKNRMLKLKLYTNNLKNVDMLYLKNAKI